MSKAIVVGDLHGKFEIVEEVLKESCIIIFIGDYLDDYTRSMIDQLRTLDLVLEAIANEPDRVYGLLGNHELSYLEPSMRCSGYNQETQYQIQQRDLTPLLDYIWLNNYLISHAGVSQKLLNNKGCSLEEYLDMGDYRQIGRARGGFDAVGGLFWCDWFKEFKPVEDVSQIVGHSGYRPSAGGILSKGNNFNIDCLNYKKEILIINADNTTEVISL